WHGRGQGFESLMVHPVPNFIRKYGKNKLSLVQIKDIEPIRSFLFVLNILKISFKIKTQP
ncbi:MAG: hypothetical protein KAU07_02730, partial [Candidatus Andersenbacteria bacterium]|nr:hypothetical protein [Candidatus Andersenbacteria bacterium]